MHTTIQTLRLVVPNVIVSVVAPAPAFGASAQSTTPQTAQSPAPASAEKSLDVVPDRVVLENVFEIMGSVQPANSVIPTVRDWRCALTQEFVAKHQRQCLMLLEFNQATDAAAHDAISSNVRLREPSEIRALYAENSSENPTSTATERSAAWRARVGPAIRNSTSAQMDATDAWWLRALCEFEPSRHDAVCSMRAFALPSAPDASIRETASWTQVIGTPKDWRVSLNRHLQAAAIFRDIEKVNEQTVPNESDRHARVLVAPPVLGAPILDIVAWIEMVDAYQLSHRMIGEIEVADRFRTDLRGYLETLQVPSLVALVDARIPLGARDIASLTRHPSWEIDAWPLLHASMAALNAREDARRRFAQLALRIGSKVGFSDEAIKWLQNRLGRVAMNLPSNFKWDAAFESDVVAHLEEAFQPGAMFDGVPRAPYFDVTDLDVCRIYAQTAAFEVFGYAWSREGALTASQQAARERQRENLMLPIREAANENRYVVGPYDLAELALSRINDHYARDTANWKPWIVFPMRDHELVTQVTSQIFENLQSDYDSLARDFAYIPNYPHEYKMHAAEVDWALDRLFGNGYDRRDGLPWIMNDLSSLFWDGYIALRR